MADRTTPDAVVLQEWFAKMVDAGVRHAVMEVSSHALALKRTYRHPLRGRGLHEPLAGSFRFSQGLRGLLRGEADPVRSDRPQPQDSDRQHRRRIRAAGLPTSWRSGDDLRPRSTADIRPAKDFEISVRGLRGVTRRAATSASSRGFSACRISTTGSARSARRSSSEFPIRHRGRHPQSEVGARQIRVRGIRRTGRP